MNELPLNVIFALGYLDGYLEDAPQECLRAWNSVRTYILSDKAPECTCRDTASEQEPGDACQ